MLKKEIPQELVQNILLNKKQKELQEINTFQANDKKMNVSFNNNSLDTIPTFPEHKSATINFYYNATITVTEGIEILSNSVIIPTLDLSNVENESEVVIIVNANGLQINNITIPEDITPNFTFHLKYYDNNFVNGINDKNNKMQIKIPGGFDSNAVNWVLYSTSENYDGIANPNSGTTNAVFVKPNDTNDNKYDFTGDTLYFRNDNSLLSNKGINISESTSSLIGYIKDDPVISEELIEKCSYNDVNYSVYLQVLESEKYLIKAFTNKEADTEYTGPIYYPFRNEIEINYDNEFYYNNDIIFDYPENETDSITIKEKEIHVNKDNCVEIKRNTIREINDTFTNDYIVCDLLKRYNKNALIITDNYSSFEWSCDEWIINEPLIFEYDLYYDDYTYENIIKPYRNNDDDSIRYYFAENKLIIEDKGSITLTNESMTTKEKQNRRATPLTMNAVGVNMIINGSIECDKLIV